MNDKTLTTEIKKFIPKADVINYIHDHIEQTDMMMVDANFDIVRFYNYSMRPIEDDFDAMQRIAYITLLRAGVQVWKGNVCVRQYYPFSRLHFDVDTMWDNTVDLISNGEPIPIPFIAVDEERFLSDVSGWNYTEGNAKEVFGDIVDDTVHLYYVEFNSRPIREKILEYRSYIIKPILSC